MRKKATHGAEAADVNITPLLDIVFILLIFFIVTATFLREEGIQIRTPEDIPPKDIKDIPPPALVLSVTEDGFVRVNNIRTIDPASVTPVVQEFMAREPNGVILVSAAPESASGVAVQVMDQAKDGGAAAVTLTLQKER